MQARVESELQELDESEESEEFESEEPKLKLVPGDLGLDDLELAPEALEGLEGLELKRLIADPHRQTAATLEPDPTKVANGGHSGARPHETLTNTDPDAWRDPLPCPPMGLRK